MPGTLFSDDDRVTSNIRQEAVRRGLETPNPEVACLLRELISDDDLDAMGLWWITAMHEPIEDSGGVPLLLALDRGWLYADYVRLDDRWNSEYGFAFVVPQAGPYR